MLTNVPMKIFTEVFGKFLVNFAKILKDLFGKNFEEFWKTFL